VIALTTWIFMIMREGLSIYQETYTWVREHREMKGLLWLPMEVRRELLAAAVALLLVGQDLTMGWNPNVYLFDASTEGGGVCATEATLSEVKSEAKWAVRGGWTKYLADPDFFEHYRPDEKKPEEITILRQPGIPVRRIRFLHLFSGLRREKDLGWFLVRMGAEKGFYVIVENYDLAYGKEFDLDDQAVLDRLVQAGRSRYYQGGHNGSPCSTWTRVRFLDGGPAPLRTRESPWGLPTNTDSQQRHCDLHSRLWRNSIRILEAIVEGGGKVSNEHPKDPNRDPYPSTWALTPMRRFERKTQMKRVSFPQCLWGQKAKKQTTISSNLEGIDEFDVHGNGDCKHQEHAQLGGKDEKGKFRTRETQTYPPELCAKLASLYVRNWESKREKLDQIDENEMEHEK